MSTAIGQGNGAWHWSAGLTVILLALGGATAYYGTRDGGPVQVARSEDRPVPATFSGAVHSIVLPHDEPILPPGPHRDVFQASCTVCHSTRLVLTQPPLSDKQWQASVEKMVKVYGAPVTPEQQHEIVTYLLAYRGTPKQVASSR
jgi:hypothetical protein